ncbi:hypothetical protein OPV22_001560 [Ensete ventricosum]|uniref:C2H2-type domain-containing protein n=2 Tax=Ensete ventricosum TaxID=4639 RepID=A0A445MAK8_ENSVE|nr:hypothetical protein OPV22_001560 [Ensete ventricosum]RWW25451.1 hypothetical protein GW17_00010203 [Ensete ventricosum]RWW84514.1 hypothetical protein BHE74_00006875 [Ensete ventricosum]RZR71287.1 hypothetical protein BHM03_00004334 [Ensete ventricosum]
MEKHRCSICFRRFSSGRALGGHMRRHVTAATLPTKLLGHHCSAVSAALPPCVGAVEEEEEEEEELTKEAAYGLRENPRKSFRLVDPEFSSAFAAIEPAGSSSVVVQDGESETESLCAAATDHRRLSKRPRHRSHAPPTSEPESSDVTTEEDVALCLMMLSRDSWTSGKASLLFDGNDEEGDGRRIAARSRPPRRGRSKHQCGTCKKVFRSYQALGGHLASHRRPTACTPAVRSRTDGDDDSRASVDAKVHECPFCFRVFPSGQALGGHKRSHLTTSAVTSLASVPPLSCSTPTTSTAGGKSGDVIGLIDLNLPAPLDDDTALSAVSDFEFIPNCTVN